MSVSMNKITREADRYRTGELDKEELDFVLDNLINILYREKDPNLDEKLDYIALQRKAKRMVGSSMRPKPVKISTSVAKKPLVAFKPAPVKKVVAKKVMKAPKKVVAKKVMKPAVKKPMKKPIAFSNVETALTGKRPVKSAVKPKKDKPVARFYVGGSVLPKEKRNVAMPKKTTTTTTKVRKPMSAETKAKIKRGVQAYHKKCKKAMAMHSKMK